MKQRYASVLGVISVLFLILGHVGVVAGLAPLTAQCGAESFVGCPLEAWIDRQAIGAAPVIAKRARSMPVASARLPSPERWGRGGAIRSIMVRRIGRVPGRSMAAAR